MTDQFSCWGVVFSFESSVSNGTHRPIWGQWQGPFTNTPNNSPTHIIANGSLSAVPAGFPDPANPSAVYDSGTLVMTFSSAPVRVIRTTSRPSRRTCARADAGRAGRKSWSMTITASVRT